MVEYRRGVRSDRKDDCWHWHSDCEAYPTKSFAIRQDKPWDGDQCRECAALSRDFKVAVARLT